MKLIWSHMIKTWLSVGLVVLAPWLGLILGLKQNFTSRNLLMSFCWTALNFPLSWQGITSFLYQSNTSFSIFILWLIHFPLGRASITASLFVFIFQVFSQNVCQWADNCWISYCSMNQTCEYASTNWVNERKKTLDVLLNLQKSFYVGIDSTSFWSANEMMNPILLTDIPLFGGWGCYLTLWSKISQSW